MYFSFYYDEKVLKLKRFTENRANYGLHSNVPSFPAGKQQTDGYKWMFIQFTPSIGNEFLSPLIGESPRSIVIISMANHAAP